ncbi:amino acid ABC transporter permease [Bisgaard Taxon 10/6]|uniref:Amino acid ABC transporter permease n=1 Tax=Exercitatus varius TaxID=67857 RepID=A0AAW6Q6F9_9PAST|nr:amino acid ABC transporter permease [Exercitatus varius]QOF67983.1 amino acid ABC transporter permease [Actinobacillus sp. GY-402]MDG2915865.1 amino acid ABC transporter permease [Exercitatus varius]MDG2918272.1 amino acid ABC transporter permease [Exercitatus varius]MDG2940962.1 amino acid ABC transporter permease [Exercitatus varius]MDG2943584.1 amino acid ABC transporter permease [Exercitatus varius]
MGLGILFQGSNFERLLGGLGVTAEIAFVSVFFACILGVLLGIVMTSRNKIIRFLCRFYLEVVRIIPLLVLLFLVYFGFAKWFNAHLDGVLVCIVVFVFWGAAEMGDLVRGALTSIEKHQVEAAYALGLSKMQTFIYILLPQSLKRVTPGAINLFTRMVKTSSLAMLIGVLEVIKVGQQIIETSLFTDPSAALWIYGVIFVLYFVICYPLSLFSKYLESRWEN